MDFYLLTPVHKLGGTNHCLPIQKDALDWMSQYVKGLRLCHTTTIYTAILSTMQRRRRDSTIFYDIVRARHIKL